MEEKPRVISIDAEMTLGFSSISNPNKTYPRGIWTVTPYTLSTLKSGVQGGLRGGPSQVPACVPASSPDYSQQNAHLGAAG